MSDPERSAKKPMQLLRTKFSERQARDWAVLREGGRVRWILTRGVIGWGTAMFMWTTAWKLLTSDLDYVRRSQITIDLIIWPIAGALFGMWTWHASEKAYAAYINRK